MGPKSSKDITELIDIAPGLNDQPPVNILSQLLHCRVRGPFSRTRLYFTTPSCRWGTLYDDSQMVLIIITS